MQNLTKVDWGELQRLLSYSRAKSYWKLDEALAEEMRPFVEDKRVVYPGGGDGSLSLVLLRFLGASEVLIVEKEHLIKPNVEALRMARNRWYFGYLTDLVKHPMWTELEWDTVILSWPANYAQFSSDLLPIMARCKNVVVLGVNDGKTSCGTRHLWEYLIERRLVKYIQHPRNDLLVYNEEPRPLEDPLVEHEKHGLTS